MGDKSSLLPFELYLKKKVDKKIDQVELFIDTVEKVLHEDLQRENSFGCHIKNCHTHVGSKKHLTSFVEAELLFHNSYYNKNFAYLTVNQMIKQLKMPDYKNILIIGYETFSELYICEVAELLRKMGQDPKKENFAIPDARIEYGIYEQTVSGGVCIRYSFCEHDKKIKDKFPSEETLFVFIVPINTTLTTHDKMMDFFFQDYEHDKEEIQCVNFGLILIAPKDGSNYWEVSSEKRQIQLKELWQKSLKTLGNKPVNFFVWISNSWYDVNRCPECFPDIENNGETRTILQEKPIFEVNRASIIPMLQLKTYTIPQPFNEKELTEAKNNLDRVVHLSSFTYHKHLIRNGNHHQFYFDTRRFFNDQRNDIKDWLKTISEDIRKVKPNPSVPVYNFIVAPRHYSNAGFVQMVNDVVFEGAARIFYFEAHKEFRGNIVAKYNDFSRIISNIKLSGKKAEIRFHYIDDTIYSAGNYIRTRSLIKSLINNVVDADNMDISIFDSVIVLLGRTSQDTNQNFVKKIERFYQYVRLSISPMRSFDNACSLCNLKEHFKGLRKIAATNKMDELCSKAIEKYNDGHVDECEMTPLKKDDEKRYNILIWHLLEERLNNRIQLDKQDSIPIISEEVEQIIKILNRFKEKILRKTLFKNMTQVNIEDVYSAFIKTITRPFFTYHIRRRQASFDFCLNELSQLIEQIERKAKAFEGYFHKKDIYKFNVDYKNKIHTKENQAKLLNQVYSFRRLAVIVNGLSDMNAFYVMRAKVLKVLLRYARLNDRLLDAILDAAINKEEIDKEQFSRVLIFTLDNHYKSIKKLIGVSRDETKSLFLEHLVVDGDEKGFFKLPHMEQENVFSQFSDRLFLYLENNKVLIDGLEELTSTTDKNGGKDRRNVEQMYFMEGYREILKLSGKDPDKFSKTFKEIYDEFLKAIDDNAYGKIINFIREMTENKEIKIFTFNKNGTFIDKWDKYVNIENDDFTDEFYDPDNIDMLDGLIGNTHIQKAEVIGNTIYIKSKSEDGAPLPDKLTYVLRLSYTDEDPSAVDLYFLVNEPKCEPRFLLIRFFTAKLLLALRSHLISLVKNKKLLYRINELKETKLKAALSIEKAVQHQDKKFFYGIKSIETLISLSDSKKWFKRYLQLASNELISEMYRKVVRRDITFSSREFKLYSNIEKYSFEYDDKTKLYYNNIENYNKNKPEINVKIRVNKESLEERPFIFFSKSASTITEFCLLLYLLGGNAAHHYEGNEKDVVVDVYGEGNYLVFNNKCNNAKEACACAKKRMHKAPIYFEEKEQSITLWTLNRYFQLVKKINKYTDYPELMDLNMQVNGKKDYFNLRLPVLADK